jgi:hypothetical protein
MTTKLAYVEWEKWFITTHCNMTMEEIESWKTDYYNNPSIYDEVFSFGKFKLLLREEYEVYCKEND